MLFFIGWAGLIGALGFYGFGLRPGGCVCRFRTGFCGLNHSKNIGH